LPIAGPPYRWLLDNGPDGPGPCNALVVAGDSAGGNLTLSTIAWARDAGPRRADAAVALSPLTDASFGSPSMKANVSTDIMLGPMFGKLARLPKVLLPFVGGIMSQARPSNPDISPLHGDLHDQDRSDAPRKSRFAPQHMPAASCRFSCAASDSFGQCKEMLRSRPTR